MYWMTSVMHQEYPEYGGSRSLLNVNRLAQIPNYTASHLRRPKPWYQLLTTDTLKLSSPNRFSISLPNCVSNPSCSDRFYCHCKVKLLLCYDEWVMKLCLRRSWATPMGVDESSHLRSLATATVWSPVPAFFWRLWRKDKRLFLPRMEPKFLDRPLSSVVTIVTELSRLNYSVAYQRNSSYFFKYSVVLRTQAYRICADSWNSIPALLYKWVLSIKLQRI
jgi:hypothetical protein